MPPLYTASVPVFRHYLAQVAGMVERAGAEGMAAQITDSFTVAQHFSTAAGFAMRTVYPLAGLEIPSAASLGPPHGRGARASGGDESGRF